MSSISKTDANSLPDTRINSSSPKVFTMLGRRCVYHTHLCRLQLCFDNLVEGQSWIGFGALSLEGVAKRAGVGKAALYRRWTSKQTMAIELIKTIGLKLTSIPDSGSLLEYLRLILLSLRRTMRNPLIRRILPDLHAEMAKTSVLSAEIRNTLQYERRERGKMIVDRAVARDELPANADRDLANDALASILYWRIGVTGGRVNRADVDKIAQFIAAGLGHQ